MHSALYDSISDTVGNSLTSSVTFRWILCGFELLATLQFETEMKILTVNLCRSALGWGTRIQNFHLGGTSSYIHRVGSHVVFVWIHCTDVRIHCTDILVECR